MVEAAGFYIAGGMLAGGIAKSLLKKPSKAPLDDEKPVPRASRGMYVPLLIGRRFLSPREVWVGDRIVASEAGAGGKGPTGGGSSQLVYYESAMHLLCVGPARALHRVRENGKDIWTANGIGFPNGITPETHPSGSTISLGSAGSFQIWWGERDQPVNDFLGSVDSAGNIRLGFKSRHKFVCYVLWIKKRLGGFPNWPGHEYEVEAHPYKSGDTYTYTGSYDALPERLTQSTGWFKNGVGDAADPHEILRAIDGSPGSATEPRIKVAGNPALGEFSIAGTIARIEGNSAATNKRYPVDAANCTYNASETIYDTSAIYVGYPQTFNPGDFLVGSGWSLVPAGDTLGIDNSATAPPGQSGANNRYKITCSASGSHFLTYSVTGVPDQQLSTGINRCVFWVRGFGATQNLVQVQLLAYGHATLPDNSHTMTFTWQANSLPLTVETNSAHGSMTLVGGGGGNPLLDWWRVEVTYRSGEGSTPADQNWKRRYILLFGGTTNGQTIFLYANDQTVNPTNLAMLTEDDGTAITGITTIQLDTPLQGSAFVGGEITAQRAGFGADGANVAHVLDQLLFETSPHGAGIDRSKYDMNSLEALGVALGWDSTLQTGEGLRAHVLIEDGGSLEGAVAGMVTDSLFGISWDPMQGKHVFPLTRDVGATPVATIPEQAVAPPQPQQSTALESLTVDRVSFVYPDRDLNYRDMPIVEDDDGRASREENQSAKPVRLNIITDQDAAMIVAARRGQELMTQPSSKRVRVMRASSRLYPGLPVYVYGIDELLRILKITPDTALNSQAFEMEVMADSYSLPTLTNLLPIANAPSTPPLPEPDAMLRVTVAPGELTGSDTPAALVLRVRSKPWVGATPIWVSSDGESYFQAVSSAPPVVGFRLVEPLGLEVDYGGQSLEIGPIMELVGPDSDQLLYLSDQDKRLGRQAMLLVNAEGKEEWFFVREWEALGGDRWRPRGLIREVWQTHLASFDIGDEVYVLNPLRATILRDPAVAASSMVYVKTQPSSGSSSVSLTAVTAASKLFGQAQRRLAGVGEVPLGAIDGSNLVYKLAAVPDPRESLQLFWNGRLLRQGAAWDYELEENQITMMYALPASPKTTQFIAWYEHNDVRLGERSFSSIPAVPQIGEVP